ncbi:MAG: single-stranded-DNA-specific exonuclease RecJ [Butyrivibrio sp.]|uniref:single-stranded-DNA-specific exonuclease RecJ n=1 Tax=Butyrivibrio sp. TaxID=28121 RepID=UPI0025D89B4A|nr:single-stranded-DNA-specific exonuclease RecJ [Butyrivibrio sp.]MCR5771540.1 single-stranded-DNA-specific exonuclease RecJ [Butyrivibrio sp.]
MSKWMIAAKKADFNKIAKEFNISPITARLIRNRGLTDFDDIKRYLYGGREDLRDAHELTDIEKAAVIMKDRIDSGCKIRIIGDYDVDGICSSYILWAGLSFATRGSNSSKASDSKTDYRLPDRIKDGYGLNERLVMEAKDDNIDTIITCDNGIAAYDQVKLAKDLGMTVVVTDHHEVPIDKDGDTEKQILPPADAVVDPKRHDCKVKFREICGGVVAYKFLQILFEKYEETGWKHSAVDVHEFFNEMLEFAALSTVCDVMPIEDENRVLVREGLKQMENSSNLGLRSLINVNGLQGSKMTAYHLGFVIGPCLNATGRLDSAMRGLDLLTSSNEMIAVNIAGDLKALNDSRKTMTQQGVDKATEEMDKYGKDIPKVIVLYQPDLHESIAGIVAGRVREKYARPTIVLTNAKEGVKGSGRSTENYDMFRELSECKDLFTKFGGHKMAAGLSLSEHNVEELRRRLNDNCTLTEEDFVEIRHLDMVLPLQYLNVSLIKEFDILEPYGNGNDKPSFAARDIRIKNGRIMGKNRNCGKYRISDDNGREYEMVYFGNMEKWHDFLTERYGNAIIDELYNNSIKEDIVLNIAYYPDINTWQGKESLQIVMTDFC